MWVWELDRQNASMWKKEGVCVFVYEAEMDFMFVSARALITVRFSNKLLL